MANPGSSVLGVGIRCAILGNAVVSFIGIYSVMMYNEAYVIRDLRVYARKI